MNQHRNAKMRRALHRSRVRTREAAYRQVARELVGRFRETFPEIAAWAGGVLMGSALREFSPRSPEFVVPRDSTLC